MKNEHYSRTVSQRTNTETYHKLRRVFGDIPSCLPSNRLCEIFYWTCRRIQLWLCFYDDEVDIDIEDLLSNPFNTQPPSLDELIRLTGFNKEWIMFMYRNFKQICSNGRMSLQQWKRIFRLLFPKSADNEFADRIFHVIAGDKTRKFITFEELILSLHGISECYCIEASTSSRNLFASSSRIAQFVFSLMEPNDQRRVNCDAFQGYAEAIYNLNIPSLASNSKELFSQMHISHSHNGTPPNSFQFPSNFKNHTLQRFNDLDTDNDGYITVEDIERILTQQFGSVRLFKEAHLFHI
uniref:EF-hand domain-containing protein n=1 Tax=Setaria digitata TaxID=48799 RepID=A0A915Q3B9_9BILA